MYIWRLKGNSMNKYLLVLTLFFCSRFSFATDPCASEMISLNNQTNRYFQKTEGIDPYSAIRKDSNLDIDIPFSIDGKAGCFHQTKKLVIDVGARDSKMGSEHDNGYIYVQPPVARFRDIPGQVDTYVLISSYGDNGSKYNNLNIDLVSFVCAGESVLSVASHSSRFSDIMPYFKIDEDEFLYSKLFPYTDYDRVALANFALTPSGQNMMASATSSRGNFKKNIENILKEKERIASLDRATRAREYLERNAGALASARIPDGIAKLFRQRVGDELSPSYGCTEKFKKALEDLRPSRMGEVFYSAGLEVYYNEYKFQIAWNKNTDLKKVNQMYTGSHKKLDGEPIDTLGAGAPLYQYAEVGWFWNKKKYHHVLKNQDDECFFETSIEGIMDLRRSDWNPLHCNALKIASKVMNAIGGQCSASEAIIDNHPIILGKDCTCYSKKQTPDGFQHISEDYRQCLKAGVFGADQQKVEEVISSRRTAY